MINVLYSCSLSVRQCIDIIRRIKPLITHFLVVFPCRIVTQSPLCSTSTRTFSCHGVVHCQWSLLRNTWLNRHLDVDLIYCHTYIRPFFRRRLLSSYCEQFLFPRVDRGAINGTHAWAHKNLSNAGNPREGTLVVLGLGRTKWYISTQHRSTLLNCVWAPCRMMLINS